MGARDTEITDSTRMDNSILGQLAMSYSPIIDRNRAVSATRLTVFPLVPGTPLNAASLLNAVADVWPEDGGKVSLNVLSESLLHELMAARPSPNVMVELPAFMASDESNAAHIQALHSAGNMLLIKGRPVREVPRDVLPCFKHSIIDLADDRRQGEAADAGAAFSRSVTYFQSGVRTLVDMEASFKRGAAAVIGWPMDDVVMQATAGKPVAQHDLQVIVELIQRVDKAEPIDKLENTLRRDPTLAFKLIRYINSAAFGLSVEISSFRHAIMMLGYTRLKRWLALLLATASKDANLKPVMFAAVRRGLMMEELVRSSGDDEMRNEMFICGVFSLLDRMFKQPFSELLKTIPVPERVYAVLAEGSGPYQPYFKLVQAVEGDTLDAIREASDNLMMGSAEINRALLKSLAAAASLE
ncbi:EAL and HDOD domain-containing protein [Methylibium rhizosphaerae]|uniref:EAL and HDOD domain-containing protein n=1 Tax=Methylibium rhizosphaerae TaxID=2570323 RepID=UPI001FEBA18F|nr:HDOD domain-containing protein [Methylibium rhizosphaerae]